MFTKILVPLDHSPLAEQAIGRAVAIAHASKAELDLVMAHQRLPFSGAPSTPSDDLFTFLRVVNVVPMIVPRDIAVPAVFSPTIEDVEATKAVPARSSARWSRWPTACMANSA